ncbi:TPA: restriction endonuclease subunit S [Vibrio vulnificus]|uniref:restriction endonuclease subunit S n=1 Tax=Vibrio parahaemolyticus TaxID=670 RepID=UPI001299B275|nr:restriction endonuclease subunit S [Vibrio parahaemolyticus]MRE02707.1 restriction endonuclease subunit S [Vibrio parahaemolyticus]HAS6068402.1 restriction endonuclease subunit S [Vibrio vulnificus]
MKPYPRYNQSSARWYSSFPENWSEVKAKRLFSNERERASSEDEQLAASQKYGVIPQALMMAQNNAKVMLALKGTDNFKQVKENDFVISLRSFEGGIEHSKYNGCISPAYTVLRLRHESSYPNYFRYALKCSPFIQALNSTSEGIRDGKTITYDEFGELLVALPSQAEQKAIATFLDRETQRIDSLIEEKQTFIKLLKEKRQALISHVVTKGLNPNVEMQDSGIEWIGQVPKHWIVRRLKHTSTLQSGIAKGKDNAGKETLSIPMLRVANVQDGYVKLDDVHEINVLPHEVERYALKGGDVLMNEGGDNDKLGRGTVWKEQIKPCIHQNHVFVIRVTDIEPEWLGWLTQSSYAKFYFFRVSKQSTNLASISSTNVKEVHLLIPPADERKIIMEYLEKQTSKLKLLVQDVEESITLLKEHRTSLISAAVTGKIDVREAV